MTDPKYEFKLNEDLPPGRGWLGLLFLASFAFWIGFIAGAVLTLLTLNSGG